MVDQYGAHSGGAPQWAVSVPGWDGSNVDVAYLDKNLRHSGIETALDEGVSPRTIILMFLSASVASVLVFFVFFLLVLFASASSGEEAAGGLLVVAMIMSTIAFFVVLLGMRVPEPVAEWRVLLGDRAGSATSTYSQIAGALRTRRMPIHPEVRPVDTGSPRDGVRYRLVLHENFYVAYVSVFAYGTSLYLGWMMWRSRRGWQLIGQFFSDILGGMLGRNSPELRMLRTERPRAMREAVHSACREGLFVAYEQRDVPLEFGFPHPQERSRIPSAPSTAPSPFSPHPFASAPRAPQPPGPSWLDTSHQAAQHAPMPHHDPGASHTAADQQTFSHQPPFQPPPAPPVPPVPPEAPESRPGWAFEHTSIWPPGAPGGPDSGGYPFDRGRDGDDDRTR